MLEEVGKRRGGDPGAVFSMSGGQVKGGLGGNEHQFLRRGKSAG